MRTRGLRILTALAAAAALVLGGALIAPTASAQSASGSSASAATMTARDALMGTWVGTYSGFENGNFAKGYEKFVITTVRGMNAKGTWQYRARPSDPWSDPSPMQLVLTPSAAGGWIVTGADVNGIYYGTLDAAGTRLDLAYQGSVNDLVSYAFTMRKK